MNTQIFCLFITAGARIMPLQHQKKTSASTEAKIAGKDTCHPNCHLFDEHTNDVTHFQVTDVSFFFYVRVGREKSSRQNKFRLEIYFCLLQKSAQMVPFKQHTLILCASGLLNLRLLSMFSIQVVTAPIDLFHQFDSLKKRSFVGGKSLR